MHMFIYYVQAYSAHAYFIQDVMNIQVKQAYLNET